MINTHWFLKFTLFFIITVHAFADEVKKVEYPRVSKIWGKVQDLERDISIRNLKVGDILKSRSYLDVPKGAQIEIELDPKNKITVMDESHLKLPDINLDSGEVIEVILVKGKIHVLSLDQNERYFSTPITRDVYANADFILEYDPMYVKTTLIVLRGSLDFRGYENDETLRVGTGEKASFVGIAEDGAPAFDILLKGRKVAKGKLTKAEEMPDNEIETVKQSVGVKKPVTIKKRKKKVIPRKPGQICAEPYAKLNECSWVCEISPDKLNKKMKDCETSIKGIQCVRRRCDANGRWSDAYILPPGQKQCTLEPKVGLCDY